MRNGTDYYGVLGVSRSAGPDEIKRRYRQLVRNHHPDVAADQEAAHQRFIAIVEAYRTLSDPVRRRAYDAVQATAPPPVTTRSAQVQEQIDDWFRHAVHRLEENDLAAAAAQCRKILGLDPHHAAAQAMLGDVALSRQEWDQALVFYSGAVSSAPRNLNYARKLRDAAEAGQSARAAAERRQRAEEQRRRAIEALNARHEYAPYSTVLGAGWLVLLLGWAGRTPGPPLTGWFPLPVNVALAAVGTGLVVGFVLGINRLGGGETRRRDPVTLALGLAAVVQFYLGVVGYVILSAVRERLVPSLSVAFAASFGLVAALAGLSLLADPPRQGLWLATFAWGGNLVFPALLLGLGLGRLGLRPVQA